MVVDEFEVFVRDAERRLSIAFAASYGPELGREATAEALAYAWQNWDRIAVMTNPVGYLFRVGQSRVRRFRFKRPPVVPEIAERAEPWVEPGLPGALAALSQRQRLAVVLIEGFGWTQSEVAELIGISRSSVQKHLDRGLASMRAALGVSSDA